MLVQTASIVPVYTKKKYSHSALHNRTLYVDTRKCRPPRPVIDTGARVSHFILLQLSLFTHSLLSVAPLSLVILSSLDAMSSSLSRSLARGLAGEALAVGGSRSKKNKFR